MSRGSFAAFDQAFTCAKDLMALKWFLPAKNEFGEISSPSA